LKYCTVLYGTGIIQIRYRYKHSYITRGIDTVAMHISTYITSHYIALHAALNSMGSATPRTRENERAHVKREKIRGIIFLDLGGSVEYRSVPVPCRPVPCQYEYGAVTALQDLSKGKKDSVGFRVFALGGGREVAVFWCDVM